MFPFFLVSRRPSVVDRPGLFGDFAAFLTLRQPVLPRSATLALGGIDARRKHIAVVIALHALTIFVFKGATRTDIYRAGAVVRLD